MSLLNNSVANLAALRDAVAEARTIANEHFEDYDWKGLSATRQVFGAEKFAWHVSFSLADFMTHISDSDVRDRSDDELADEIWSCWDTDWDDLQIETPVGDFRVGSSDFKQRDSEHWGAAAMDITMQNVSTIISTSCQDGALGLGEMRATLELRIEEDGTATLAAEDQYHDQLTTVSEAQGLTLVAGHQLPLGRTVIVDFDKVSDLAKQLEPLVARVLPGRDSYWNGSNWIGYLEEDAWDAWTEITTFFEELEAGRWTTDTAVWDAEDYISYGHDVTSQTTDAELTQLAAEYVAEAERENIYFLYGSHGEGVEAMRKILFKLREELKSADEEDE